MRIWSRSPSHSGAILGAVSRLLSGVLLLLLASPPAAAAAPDKEGPKFPPVSYYATLKIGARLEPIGVTVSPQGPLFALPALVDTFGGRLFVGPLQESHRFLVSNREVVAGTTSSVITLDREIVPISMRPVNSMDGLMVPIDLLQRTWGQTLGVAFSWNDEQRLLSADRRATPDIALAIEAVDIQGTSTVVLDFETQPAYRIESGDGFVDVLLRAHHPKLAERPTRDRRSLIRDIQVRTDRVRLVLEPGAVAAEPYELRRGRFGDSGFRIVLDVSLAARALPANSGRFQGSGPAPRIIVLDPGHGGQESGAIGAAGTEEKTLTLELSRELARRIEQTLPVRVILTRTQDIDLPLESRAALANQQKAELFISLHLNSSRSSTASGAETYFLSLQASDHRAETLAHHENLPIEAIDQTTQGATTESGESSSDEDDLGLQLLLWDLAQSSHLKASQRLASLIQQELNLTLDLRDRGVRQAPFTVLMGATMPAVLLELGFISNIEEEHRLNDLGYRIQLLDAVVKALQRYYAENDKSLEGRR